MVISALNRILCRDAVPSYKCELSRKERVDFGVLNEW